MLSGQIITLQSSIMIGIIGMTVVIIKLGLLALVVLILSRVITKVDSVVTIYKLGKEKISESTKKVENNNKKSSEEISEEEIAAISVTICEESGLNLEDFVITSITRRKD